MEVYTLPHQHTFGQNCHMAYTPTFGQSAKFLYHLPKKERELLDIGENIPYPILWEIEMSLRVVINPDTSMGMKGMRKGWGTGKGAFEDRGEASESLLFLVFPIHGRKLKKKNGIECITLH